MKVCILSAVNNCSNFSWGSEKGKRRFRWDWNPYPRAIYYFYSKLILNDEYFYHCIVHTQYTAYTGKKLYPNIFFQLSGKLDLINCFKVGDKMVLFTLEDQVFMVVCYILTRSPNEVIRQFRGRFPHRNTPTKITVLNNYQKCQLFGTSCNRNKGNSGRRRTTKTAENEQRALNFGSRSKS